MRRIDCHVHLVGDGSSGSGCWVAQRSPVHRLLTRIMLRELDIPASAIGGGLDDLYAERLARQIDGSSLDAAVLLAQDVPHADDGTPLPAMGAFHVPNDHLFAVAGRFPGRFIPAASIHPARHDALDELERCLAAGARVLKLLPNCLNVDCADPRFRRFWKRMAQAGMILLAHTGGEKSLPVLRPEFADPRRLRGPLECGVAVIAAHAAGRSGMWDPDYTHHLVDLFREFPRLFADNSALCSPNRSRTIARILPRDVVARVVHGSDYPIPVGGLGPWMLGHIDRTTWRNSRRIRNVLERDAHLKEAIGFPEATFTRMAELLGE